MRLPQVARISWILAAFLWLLFMFTGLPTVPALGPLFDVNFGIWAHPAERLESRVVRGLMSPVTITIDRAGVPHIFAENQYDLYLAQGLMTASQRLFQIDVATRATSGRLTELVGEKARAIDEFFVRFGLRESSRYTFQKYSEQPAARMMMEAYALGVNRWINSLQEYPPEYKLLQTSPKAFEPSRIVNMSRALTFNLSGRSFDLDMSRVLEKVGADGMLDLFPEFLPSKYEDFVYTGKALGRTHSAETPELFEFKTGLRDIPTFPWANPGQGSNNWAVSAEKSASGTSLFANDTHLGLNLPNVWYENQLSCPEFNVYGVSLAAVPGIINGLNRDVAWGPTNGTTDVLDFYEIEFESVSSPYYVTVDGRRKAIVTREKIFGKNESSESYVDVVRTHLGYLIHREGRLGLVASWQGFQVGNELQAVERLYSAKTARDCLASFTRSWNVPIQNFICADAQHIGWQHAGITPARGVGEGRTIMDGRKVKIAMADRPGIAPRLERIDPPEGFLLSANQKILPPGSAHYMGWDYEPPWRGKSIRRALVGAGKLSSADMIALQNNALDLEAETVLPTLLKLISRDRLSAEHLSILAKLEVWNFVARSDGVEATIYKEWLKDLKEAIFADEWSPFVPRVKDARLAWMLDRLLANPDDSDRRWLNGAAIGSVVAESFLKAFNRLNKDGATAWIWGQNNAVAFAHLARIPGFGTALIERDGSSDSIPGISARHGAVYKFVVETGTWPKAWIQVPGGNEGDPFSRDYERYVQDWAKGEMRQIEFYRDVGEARAAAARVIELRPAEESE